MGYKDECETNRGTKENIGEEGTPQIWCNGYRKDWLTACQAINCDAAPRRKEGITYTCWMNDNNFVLFDLSRSHTTCVALFLSCRNAQSFLKQMMVHGEAPYSAVSFSWPSKAGRRATTSAQVSLPLTILLTALTISAWLARTCLVESRSLRVRVPSSRAS